MAFVRFRANLGIIQVRYVYCLLSVTLLYFCRLECPSGLCHGERELVDRVVKASHDKCENVLERGDIFTTIRYSFYNATFIQRSYADESRKNIPLLAEFVLSEM